jgi:hypothetical protein
MNVTNKSGINLRPIFSNISSFRVVVLVFTRKHTGIAWSFTEGKPHQEVTSHCRRILKICPRRTGKKCVEFSQSACNAAPISALRARFWPSIDHRFRFDTTFLPRSLPATPLARASAFGGAFRLILVTPSVAVSISDFRGVPPKREFTRLETHAACSRTVRYVSIQSSDILVFAPAFCQTLSSRKSPDENIMLAVLNAFRVVVTCGVLDTLTISSRELKALIQADLLSGCFFIFLHCV